MPRTLQYWSWKPYALWGCLSKSNVPLPTICVCSRARRTTLHADVSQGAASHRYWWYWSSKPHAFEFAKTLERACYRCCAGHERNDITSVFSSWRHGRVIVQHVSKRVFANVKNRKKRESSGTEYFVQHSTVLLQFCGTVDALTVAEGSITGGPGHWPKPAAVSHLFRRQSPNNWIESFVCGINMAEEDIFSEWSRYARMLGHVASKDLLTNFCQHVHHLEQWSKIRASSVNKICPKYRILSEVRPILGPDTSCCIV